MRSAQLPYLTSRRRENLGEGKISTQVLLLCLHLRLGGEGREIGKIPEEIIGNYRSIRRDSTLVRCAGKALSAACGKKSIGRNQMSKWVSKNILRLSKLWGFFS